MNTQKHITVKFGDGTATSVGNVTDAEIEAHIKVDDMRRHGRPEHEQWAKITSSMNPHWCQDWFYDNGELRKEEYDPTDLEEGQNREMAASSSTIRTTATMSLRMELHIRIGRLKIDIQL